MEMTVMKEEVYYTHRPLEAGGMSYYAGPYKISDSGEGTDVLKPLLWFLWEETGKAG